jgi:DNA mismatch endonuclease (patch repair protein)
MADSFSKKQRSRIMALIKSRGTNPEKIVKKALRGLGFSYQSKMKGSPDFINNKRHIAIFVHGCFWHMCLRHYIAPKSNKAYWIPKISKNVKRDKVNKAYLKSKGYKVITIWEHDVDKNLKGKLLNKLDVNAK